MESARNCSHPSLPEGGSTNTVQASSTGAFSKTSSLAVSSVRTKTWEFEKLMCSQTSHAGKTTCCQTVLTPRLALSRLSKSAPQTCPQRDQDCALLTFTKDVLSLWCSQQGQSRRFRTQPCYSGRCFHARLSKMSWLGYKRQQSA